MRHSLLALLLLTTTALSADSAPCRGFELGGEALYVKPTHCSAYYAGSFDEQGERTAEKLFDIIGPTDWGFHLFGQYRVGCYFVRLSYTRFDSSSTSVAERGDANFLGFYNPVIPAGDSVTGRLSQRYQNIDLRAGSLVCRCPRAQFALYGNARWAEIRVRLNSTSYIASASADSFSKQSSTFDGGGAGVGGDVHIDLWCQLGLHLRAGIVGLIGELTEGTVKAFDATNSREIFINSISDTAIVVATDLQVGLDYAYTCGCFDLKGEVGYRLDYYADALFMRFCDDFGVGGLYFGITVGY